MFPFNNQKPGPVNPESFQLFEENVGRAAAPAAPAVGASSDTSRSGSDSPALLAPPSARPWRPLTQASGTQGKFSPRFVAET